MGGVEQAGSGLDGRDGQLRMAAMRMRGSETAEIHVSIRRSSGMRIRVQRHKDDNGARVNCIEMDPCPRLHVLCASVVAFDW
jgi:hypothetical protein